MPSAVEIWTSIGTLASFATCAAAIDALEHHSPMSICTRSWLINLSAAA